MNIHINAPVLARMAGEVSGLSALRPASRFESAETCGSAAVARALAELSDARSKAFASVIRELEQLSTAMTGALQDAQDNESTTVETLRSIDPDLRTVGRE